MNRKDGSGRTSRNVNAVSHPTPSAPLHLARLHDHAVCLPCGAIYRARPAAFWTPECRSSDSPLRQFLLRRPGCAINGSWACFLPGVRLLSAWLQAVAACRIAIRRLAPVFHHVAGAPFHHALVPFLPC